MGEFHLLNEEGKRPNICCKSVKFISFLGKLKLWYLNYKKKSKIFCRIQDKLTVWKHKYIVLSGYQNFWGVYNKMVEF